MNWPEDMMARIRRAQKLLDESKLAFPAVFNFAHAMPVAAWVKAPDGTMLWINAAYEARFGKPLDVYHGQQDRAVWGDEVAMEFGLNDSRAITSPVPILVEEDCMMPTGETLPLKFWKFPVFDQHTGQLLGVGGIEVTS